MSGDRRFGDMKVTALLTETKTATSEIVAASDLGLPLPSNFTAVGTLPGTNTYITITTPICTSLPSRHPPTSTQAGGLLRSLLSDAPHHKRPDLVRSLLVGRLAS